jgi:predicted phosphodiesterase
MPFTFDPLSRRRFLKTTIGLGAAALLPGCARGTLSRIAGATAPPASLASHGGASDRLVLLSDLHVSGRGKGNMAAYMSHAIRQVLALDGRPDRVLVAGDCAHLRGKEDDYAEYFRLLEPLGDAGLPVHMTLGNHDTRDNFWDALPGEYTGDGVGIDRQSAVVRGRAANWFLLDSLCKTNRSAGELGADQLGWLEARLDEHTDKPALVMLHHDPDFRRKGSSLRDSDQLLAITRPRRHVKALFFGHTHVWETTTDRSGIHMVNLPATGYTLWMRSFVGWVDCRVYRRGATLITHAIKDRDRDRNQSLQLAWRTG